MRSLAGTTVCTLTLAVLLCAGTAVAELSVSVTISGSVDEILPVLRLLQEVGITAGADAAEQDQLRLQIHSVVTEERQPAQGAAPAVPAPKPVLAMSDAKVTPAQSKRGDVIVVSVRVSDPDRVVDTVAARFDGPDGAILDLYDNGQKGDAKALDGVWSRSVQGSGSVTPGRHTVEITAYDASAVPVVRVDEDGTVNPLKVRTEFTTTE